MYILIIILYGLVFILNLQILNLILKVGKLRKRIKKLEKIEEQSCCDNPSEEKCEQCQEIGKASPLNRG